MFNDPITRRQATKQIAAVVGGAGFATACLPLVSRALAQPATTQPVLANSVLDTMVKKGRTRRRTLKVEINIDAFQTPARLTRSDQMPDIRSLKFDSAAVVFPILRGTASSETDVDNVVGVLSFDDRPRDVTPQYNEGYHSGTRLGKWELQNLEGREAQLALTIPMTTWEVELAEASATNFPWPNGKWSKIAESTFQPQMFVDRDRPEISRAIDSWTSGKDPKTIPPFQLAKYLCGKVVETIQPSGDGYYSNRRNGQFAGLELKGAAQTLLDARGTEHDIACLLAAVYRNAGLPARTVIGHDISETKGQRSTPFDRNKSGSGPHLRSWVEFCLYDPQADVELWLPADPVRIRGFSSRVQPLEKPWKFFGSHDELDDVLPFAFQYHPPTTVVAHGAPAFWGWLTIPETQVATQWLRFNTTSTPVTPESQQRNRK